MCDITFNCGVDAQGLFICHSNMQVIRANTKLQEISRIRVGKIADMGAV